MRISHQTKLVLRMLLDAPAEEVYGYQVAEATGLAAGVIYPILRRLEDNGLLDSRWEVIDESQEGRRRRRYYRLTAHGAQTARDATRDQAPALRQLVPGWPT